MPNLNSVFGEEIRRLARKEIRAQGADSKQSGSKQRSEIAELKRRLNDLEKRLAKAEKQSGKSAGRGPAKAAASSDNGSGRRPRFSPKWVSKHREKLGLSAAEYGKLAGVSALTIYNWEKGASTPRERQLNLWGEIRTLGKREARKRLDAMNHDQPEV